jgi:hypothetical protein
MFILTFIPLKHAETGIVKTIPVRMSHIIIIIKLTS